MLTKNSAHCGQSYLAIDKAEDPFESRRLDQQRKLDSLMSHVSKIESTHRLRSTVDEGQGNGIFARTHVWETRWLYEVVLHDDKGLLLWFQLTAKTALSHDDRLFARTSSN